MADSTTLRDCTPSDRGHRRQRPAHHPGDIAAAEVSGIVALLLERNPKLTPADIRRILTASAKRLVRGGEPPIGHGAYNLAPNLGFLGRLLVLEQGALA